MYRKLNTVIVVLLIISLSTTIAFANSPSKFQDVADNHWAKNDINSLFDKGIINGVGNGKFNPGGHVTIDQFIKMCVASLGYTFDTSSYQYWATPYINKAVELGLIYAKQFPNPNVAIKREEMASIAIKTLGMKKTLSSSSLDGNIITTLADYRIINDYYKQAVIDAYREGLITGKGNNLFDPKGITTRAEASTVMMRILDESRRSPYTPSSDIPWTTVYFEEWTDDMGWMEVSQKFYAPKNIAGGYEKALTDFYTWAKSTERQKDGFWMNRYNPHQKNISVSCLNSYELENAPGIKQAEGLVLSFGADMYRFNTSKLDYGYDLVFYSDNTLHNDPSTNSLYLNEHYKPYLDQLFSLFFEKDAAMVRQLFEKHVNSLSDTIREDKLELANGRSVHIVSGKTGLTLWFTEKLK